MKGFGTWDVFVVHFRAEFGRTTPAVCWFILLVAEDEGLRCPQHGATCSSPGITGESGDLASGFGWSCCRAHLFASTIGCFFGCKKQRKQPWASCRA